MLYFITAIGFAVWHRNKLKPDEEERTQWEY